MYKYTIKFLALTETIAFDISSPVKETIEEFVKELLFIFARVDEENEKIIVESHQQNSPEIQAKIEEFTNKFKDKLPALNGVPAYFRKLKEGEHFFFLPNLKFEPLENIKLYDYLKAAAEGKDFEEVHGQTKELFEGLFQKYFMSVVGDKRISIGEPVKENRVCRFCNNKRDNVTFNNKAHAISEGLGNKTVVLYDECDACNTEFSQTIEPDIIQYLSLFRTIYDVKGKGGSKKFKGENFDLKKEETIHLTFKSDEDRPKEFSMPYSIKLETHDPITLQNIYKCLTKYFLSVIDDKYLPHFSKTIEWINGKAQLEQLPRIGEMISYHAFTAQPKLVFYIRKDADKSLPFAVGEFYFTCKIFAFIIPLTDQDDKDFTDPNDFDNYWQNFQHFKKSKGWAFMDYSNNKARKFILNLNFELRDKSNDTPSD